MAEWMKTGWKMDMVWLEMVSKTTKTVNKYENVQWMKADPTLSQSIHEPTVNDDLSVVYD
jgi:hypothetical protein